MICYSENRLPTCDSTFGKLINYVVRGSLPPLNWTFNVSDHARRSSVEEFKEKNREQIGSGTCCLARPNLDRRPALPLLGHNLCFWHLFNLERSLACVSRPVSSRGMINIYIYMYISVFIYIDCFSFIILSFVISWFCFNIFGFILFFDFLNIYISWFLSRHLSLYLKIFASDLLNIYLQCVCECSIAHHSFINP